MLLHMQYIKIALNCTNNSLCFKALVKWTFGAPLACEHNRRTPSLRAWTEPPFCYSVVLIWCLVVRTVSGHLYEVKWEKLTPGRSMGLFSVHAHQVTTSFKRHGTSQDKWGDKYVNMAAKSGQRISPIAFAKL